MGIYRTLLKPVLFKMDAEDAHHIVLSMAPYFLGAASAFIGREQPDPALETEVAGRRLTSPIGLAAGFDKNGRLVESLSALGFGFAEIGSVTGERSAGNARPRIFRLPADEGIINNLGLNGDGCEIVAYRLKQSTFSLPIGLNIARTNSPRVTGDAAIADQVKTFRAIRELPLTYVTLNLSCPNTHEGCLQATDELKTTLSEFQKLNTNRLPIFLKLSPDSTDALLDDFVGIGREFGVAGFVCSNTALNRSHAHTPKSLLDAIGRGGLSGPPLKPLALSLVRRVSKRKSTAQQIIGCGGVSSVEDVLDFARAGACAVQMYTALVYQGPGVVRRLNRELSKWLSSRGTTFKEIVGAEERELAQQKNQAAGALS